MKDNVDLTQNRMFSRPSRIPNSRLIKLGNRKYPWDFSSNFDNWYISQSSVIELGNKEDREKQKIYKRAYGNYCDCCGELMNSHPWDKEIGICHKCEDNALKDKLNKKQRCPWRMNGNFLLTSLRNAIITEINTFN